MSGQQERAGSWPSRAVVGFWRAVVLTLMSWLVPAIWAAAVLLCFVWRGNPWSWIAPIVIAAAFTIVLAKPVGQLFRRFVRQWTATSLPNPYREIGAVTELSTGYWFNGRSYFRTSDEAKHDLEVRQTFTDPARWRDVRWLALAPVVVGLVSAVPVAGVLGAIAAAAVAVGVIVGGQPSSGGAVLVTVLGVVLLGAVLLVVGVATAPYAWRVLRPAALRWLNAPATTDLSDRVRELTAQRAELTVAQSAEISRIERDLHDGAQARLVALGLSLATAERVMSTDPDQAMRLVREAREGASTSLAELRELVRGINPPVLAERGLVDAIRALALDCPLPVEVESQLAGRADAPVESALYFGASEVLTNAVKHSGATRVCVRLRHADGGIAVEIDDDGRGGAVVRPGGGLDGVRRRLAAFDGALRLVSPAGGPTRVTLVVPCVLS